MDPIALSCHPYIQGHKKCRPSESGVYLVIVDSGQGALIYWNEKSGWNTRSAVIRYYYLPKIE